MTEPLPPTTEAAPVVTDGPEQHAWPVRPWGKGDAADDYFRDFNAFEPWLDRQLQDRRLDHIDLNITDKIELYSMLCAVVRCGIDAGRNPWDWALRVEQETTTAPPEAP